VIKIQNAAAGGGTLNFRIREQLLLLYKMLNDKRVLDSVRGREQRKKDNIAKMNAKRLASNSFYTPFVNVHKQCQSNTLVRADMWETPAQCS